jgi:hypothetical protein
MQRTKIYDLPETTIEVISRLGNAAHVIEKYDNFIAFCSSNPAMAYLIEDRPKLFHILNPATCWLIKEITLTQAYDLHSNIGATYIIDKIMAHADKITQYAESGEIPLKGVISITKDNTLKALCSNYQNKLVDTPSIRIINIIRNISSEFCIPVKEIYKLLHTKYSSYITHILSFKIISALEAISNEYYDKYKYDISVLREPMILLYLLSVKIMY